MRIIIAGAGKVGSHLARMLSRESNVITVIDDDQDRLNALVAVADVDAISGKPTSIAVLRQADVSRADLFVAVYPAETQEVNIMSSLIAKKLGAAKVVARINDESLLTPENRLMFKEMGIELMFYPEKIAADEIMDQLRHTAFIESMDFVRGKLQISVFKLDEDSPVMDKSILEFVQSLPGDVSSKFRVIAISRSGKTIIPHSDTRFQYGDLVFTVATREGVDAIIKYFGKTNIEIDKVMIIGGTETAAMLASQLCGQVSCVKIIEKDRKTCLKLSEKLPDSVQIVCGDARNSEFLYEEAIKDYDAFVALTPSDETNVLACVVARKLGVPRTVAQVENLEYLKLAEDMGVDAVINKKLITASRIFKFTLSGKARFVRYMTGTNAEVIEYTAAPSSAIVGKPIKNLGFPENAVIGGVVRGSNALIAVGDTVIEPYDRVVVLSLPETIAEIDKFFRNGSSR